MAKYFKCITNKNPTAYSVGEEIIFSVWAKEAGEKITCGAVKWSLAGDDGETLCGEGAITPDSPLTLSYTLQRAGFVHLICTAVDKNGEKLEGFDPLEASAGADILSLTYSDTLPEDFEEYWREIETMVADFTPEVIYYQEKAAPAGFKAYYVKVSTPSGMPASGCISVPQGEGTYPIRTVFIGYGYNPASFEYHKGEIWACFNAHGFENDKTTEELTELYEKTIGYYGFIDEDNASNKTTYFRNMMIRNLVALKYVKTLPEWNGKELIAVGGSQGGLQAITVAAHDKDVTGVIVAKPWLCDLKSVDEGYLRGWRPNVAEGLRYFDTVAQGMHLTCPVQISCALGDYVCPPKTVMALYNSIKSEKRITFTQSATHSYTPPEDETVETWF